MNLPQPKVAPPLAASIGILILLCAACSGSPEGELRFPAAPVILISVDTLRADRLPAYGYDGVETPAIDRLRQDAVLFEHAYSPCPLTLPAHVSLLTGLLPYQHGVRDNVGYRLDAGARVTLPAFLAARGYATGAAVSAYVLRGRTGLGDAFDTYDDGVDYGQQLAMGDLQRPGTQTVAVARTWIDARGEEPFFYFLHLFEPHSPYTPPEPFKSRFAAPYDGEIAAADAALGGLFDHLRQRGLYDRALIVLLADHGEGLGDHGEQEHGILLYREAIQVPLLIKLPGGVRGGTSVTAPAQLADIFPTIAALLGQPLPAGLAGQPLLVPGGELPSRRLYSESYYARIHLGWSELRALTDERYQFIAAPRPELYDLAADPAQQHNVLDEQRREYFSRRDELASAHTDTFSGPGAVDNEDAARLAALGYLASPASASSGPRPDPKDALPVLKDLERAFALAASERCAEAIPLFDDLLQRFPAMLDVQVQRAACLHSLGQREEALAGYRRALALSPESADGVLIKMGEIFLQLGQLDEARQHAEAVLASIPGQGHALLARVAEARGDLGQALTAAQAAVAADQVPRPDAVVLLARLRLAQGQYPEALAELDALAARIRTGAVGPVPALHFLRGDALARLGRGEEAVAAFQEEIRHFPQHSQTFANLAFLYASLRRFDQIEPLLEAMVAARPQPEVYQLAADTAARLGDATGAESWRRRGRLVGK